MQFPRIAQEKRAEQRASSDSDFQRNGKKHAEEDFKGHETIKVFLPGCKASHAIGDGHADGVKNVDGEGIRADIADAGYIAPVAYGEEAKCTARDEVEYAPLFCDEVGQGQVVMEIQLLQRHAAEKTDPRQGCDAARLKQFRPAAEHISEKEVGHELDQPGVAKKLIQR